MLQRNLKELYLCKELDAPYKIQGLVKKFRSLDTMVV